MTTIITIITIIASIVAIIAYRKDHIEKPSQHLEHLQIQYGANQKLNNELIKVISEFADNNNCWDNDFIDNLSFRTCINGLKHSRDTNLSEQQIRETLELDLSEYNIRSMINSLEQQFNALDQIKHSFYLTYKNGNYN